MLMLKIYYIFTVMGMCKICYLFTGMCVCGEGITVEFVIDLIETFLLFC